MPGRMVGEGVFLATIPIAIGTPESALNCSPGDAALPAGKGTGNGGSLRLPEQDLIIFSLSG